jgi:curved DNA-binding protein CbpA
MDPAKIDRLQAEILRKNIVDDALVEGMKQNQLRLTNKVPTDKYNKINAFLEAVTDHGDILATTGVALNRSELVSRYETQEEKYEREFKAQQQTREQHFIEQQRTRRKKYETELNSFNKSTINARKLFKLDDDYTGDQLKLAYKKLAMVYHPDRPTGDNQKFQVITKAYMALLEELKLNQPVKNFNELKQNSSSFMEEQNNRPMRNVQMGQKFDAQLFNKIYTENRLHKAEDDGYGNWMSDNAMEEKDIEKSAVFSDKFNIGIFNSTFKDKVVNENQVVEYKTPGGMFSGGGDGTYELGVDNIGNFSGDGFTDYKEAHTTHRLVDSDTITAKQFKNVEDLKKHRENMVPLTQGELRKLHSEETDQSSLESLRQENVMKHDRGEFDVYNKMNKRMLESNFFSDR